MGLKNAGGPAPGDTGSRSVGKQVETWRNRDAMGSLRLNSSIRTNDKPVPFGASGGTEIATPTTKWHIFTSPGTFTVDAGGPTGSGTCEILIVAGGGGGGGNFYSAGGGAGGVVHGPAIPLTVGSYSITVGGGGHACPGGPFDNTGADYQGKPSTFVESPTVTVTAIGGGSGGMQGTPSGGPTGGTGISGGSAGGVAQYAAPTSVAATPQPVPGSYTAYGNMAYGNAVHPLGDQFQGGGGGGAGGINRPSNNPGQPLNDSYGGRGGTGQPFTNFPAPVIVPEVAPLFPPAPMHASDRTLTGMGTDGWVGGGGGGASYYATGPGYFANVNISGQPGWAGDAKVGKDGGGGAGGGSRDVLGANGWPACYMTGGGGGGANYNTPGPNSINPFNPIVGGGGSGGPGSVMIRYVVT